MDNQTSVVSKGSTFSAMTLVAGTCIGGGMLALPVSAGIGGLFPALFWLFISWMAMTATSLLLLEANLWMKEGDHVISMARRFLGPIGEVVSWLLYLFIAYASLVGYAAGGGTILATCFDIACKMGVSKDLAIVLFTVVLTTLIYLGTKIVGRTNTVLFLGMCVAYLLLVVMGLDEIQPALFGKVRWVASTLSIPFLLTSFSHQTMVPSLTPYLKRDPTALRKAIIGGTAIAFFVYALWLVIMIGIVPIEGPNSLREAFDKALPATEFISHHVVGFWIVPIANFFSLFSIITSYLGICLGLFDFLSDGLKVPERGWGKIFLWFLIVLPTLYFTLNFERVFLVAFETTGGIGDAILNGIIPVLMVYVGRYTLGFRSDWGLPGGKTTLFILGCFFTSTFFWEISIILFDLLFLAYQ